MKWSANTGIFIRNLDKFQIPYVFIQGIYSEMKEKPHILMDDARGGYLVTRYLTELGHRNIMGFFKAEIWQGWNAIRDM